MYVDLISFKVLCCVFDIFCFFVKVLCFAVNCSDVDI